MSDTMFNKQSVTSVLINDVTIPVYTSEHLPKESFYLIYKTPEINSEPVFSPFVIVDEDIKKSYQKKLNEEYVKKVEEIKRSNDMNNLKCIVTREINDNIFKIITEKIKEKYNV